jgi:hypothetical protein
MNEALISSFKHNFELNTDGDILHKVYDAWNLFERFDLNTDMCTTYHSNTAYNHFKKV